MSEITSTNDKDAMFVGYCDDSRCRQGVGSMTAHKLFIADYGDLTTLQAVINADRNGNALLSVTSEANSAALSWQAPRDTPESVAKEVTR